MHKFSGHVFLEIVYKDVMQIEFAQANINYVREKEFDINYKGIILPQLFYAGFFVNGNDIADVKACKEGISNGFIAQTFNYLKGADCTLGLLINFGKPGLEHKRPVL